MARMIDRAKKPIRTVVALFGIAGLLVVAAFIGADVSLAQTPPTGPPKAMVDGALAGEGKAKGTINVSVDGQTATILFELVSLEPDSDYKLFFYCLGGPMVCNTSFTHAPTSVTFPARVLGSESSDTSGALVRSFTITDLSAGSYQWHTVVARQGFETFDLSEAPANSHIHPGVVNRGGNISFTIAGVPLVCTPTPAAAPAITLAPLIDSGNLVRVWYFDPATQNDEPDYGWGLYDPQPTFALASTVKELGSGQFYWIEVKKRQTVTLNCETRILFGGWNPVNW